MFKSYQVLRNRKSEEKLQGILHYNLGLWRLHMQLRGSVKHLFLHMCMYRETFHQNPVETFNTHERIACIKYHYHTATFHSNLLAELVQN